MEQADNAEGRYDDLLIGHAKSLQASGRTASLVRLSAMLHESGGMSRVEASRIVADFSERGVLQRLFSSGPYDVWLTGELEKARRLNQGINGTALAKKLQRERQVRYAADKTKLSNITKSLLGLADANDIVDDYFLRYGLKPIMGPYPLYGIIIVVIAEAILFLPILFLVHFALSSLFLGRPLTAAPFTFFFFLFLAERTWKNWRKLRSPNRWSSYDSARNRLPHTH